MFTRVRSKGSGLTSDNHSGEKHPPPIPSLQFSDRHPASLAQRSIQEMAANSPRSKELSTLQAMADSRNGAAPSSSLPSLTAEEAAQRTGMPHQLKQGLEHLGGVDLSAVKVHYNSDKPAQLHALAYAQGQDIHLAPGQEQHLPHEGWHVVQQMQGRVKPTTQLQAVSINDEPSLEQEADVMGKKATEGSIVVQQRCGGAQRQSSVIQRINNVWPSTEEDAIKKDPLGLASSATPEATADAMLKSGDEVYRYGREPATDEQVEILGGASYLRQRKRAWKAELTARSSLAPPPKQQTSWEKFQEKVGALSPGPLAAPWFLDPKWGYQISLLDNKNWIQQATAGLNAPDPQDPQQVLGQSYGRDTDLTSRSDWAQTQRADVSATSDAGTFSGKTGWVFRIFNNVKPEQASEELRLKLSSQGAVPYTPRFQLAGTTLATQHFPNGGYANGTRIDCNQIGGGGIFLQSPSTKKTRLPTEWSGKLESEIYHKAVTVPEDSLGIRFQTADVPKARNRSKGKDLDDSTASDLKHRYENSPASTVGGNALSLEHSLGPSRGRINIEDLGWDISVAQYRRLGGDILFQEAAHPVRDLNHYSNKISPASAVDVENPNWYYDSQKDNPDRFVGGRSNSTFLYLKTASVLFQRAELTQEECLDVMAFVAADMVVSGEHSLPECMTTIVMAAENSPPWNATTLNVGSAVAALKSWLMMIDDSTLQTMRADARDALIAQLGKAPKDYKLLKNLVILVKVLDSHP